MTKEEFFKYNLEKYGIDPDYPFENDFETAVLRHPDNKKWYALTMRVSKSKFGHKSDKAVWVVNMKLPIELFGSFNANDGVYPAYHMNKLHWISVLIEEAEKETIEFLTDVSFDATQKKSKTNKKQKKLSHPTC